MPKEIIHGRPDDTFKVKVAWDRDGNYVQVGTTNDHAVILTKQILDSPEAVLFDGFHATFSDRGSVNRLIRSLRTARDAAFGRDA